MTKVRKAVPLIEDKIKVKISFPTGKIAVSGIELNEFLVEQILRAVDFGFDVRDALLLAGENFVLEFIDIKEHTRRKNLKDVRARIIGTGGKVKRTIENLTGAVLHIEGNTVGIIVDHEHFDAVVQAVESITQGSKHANVFSYLEKRGVEIRNSDDDLGLREKWKKRAE